MTCIKIVLGTTLKQKDSHVEYYLEDTQWLQSSLLHLQVGPVWIMFLKVSNDAYILQSDAVYNTVWYNMILHASLQ